MTAKNKDGFMKKLAEELSKTLEETKKHPDFLEEIEKKKLAEKIQEERQKQFEKMGTDQIDEIKKSINPDNPK